ncbi:hypothetical protein [Sphingomonas sp.]|uniref:hypothetical protein n=1 Tax=Sphingomonas sp. TaxID=28214 RepID=UPI002C6FFBD6|nr:hypothetical protein [Sphingomonas sp.]HTG38167.1 hypothetical protein [Sphingomonas sp.]
MRVTAFPGAIMMAGLLAGCGTSDASSHDDNSHVVLRNLAETEIAAPKPDYLKIQGELVATPSDQASRYYLLRRHRTLNDTDIAILRQEKNGRVAYARTEVDCARRLFHVVGVASSRGRVESNVAHDGPLRSISGLPLRQELARHICEQAGTPLPRV